MPRNRLAPAPCARAFAALGVCAALAAGPGQADSLIASTHLVDLHTGGGLSDTPEKFKLGGYELSDGTPVRFTDWYSTDMPALHVTMMTQVNPNFGIYWGFSSVETGPKYQIDAGVTLGFLLIHELGPKSTISLSATAVLGGRMTESPCTADYGAIGGVQTVNCRLAAGVMPPADTLNYLVNESPPDRAQISLRYRRVF